MIWFFGMIWKSCLEILSCELKGLTWFRLSYVKIILIINPSDFQKSPRDEKRLIGSILRIRFPQTNLYRPKISVHRQNSYVGRHATFKVVRGNLLKTMGCPTNWYDILGIRQIDPFIEVVNPSQTFWVSDIFWKFDESWSKIWSSSKFPRNST